MVESRHRLTSITENVYDFSFSEATAQTVIHELENVDLENMRIELG